MKKALSTIFLISFVFSLSAAIMYRDIPDTKISASTVDELKIDFNADGKTEFTIRLEDGGIIVKTEYIFVDNTGINAKAFSKNDKIHSSQASVNTGRMVIRNASGGNFTIGEELYIGVSKRNFPVAGSVAFGWIRIKVQGNQECTVYDYAIEDYDNRAIIAGATSGGLYAGIPGFDKPEFNVFPNPTSDMLYINYGTKENEVENVSIYTINGNLLRSFDSAQKGISLAEYHSGQYIVSIRFNNQAVETRRIVVE